MREVAVFFAVEVEVPALEDEDLATPALAVETDFVEVDFVEMDFVEEDESEPALSFRVDVLVL